MAQRDSITETVRQLLQANIAPGIFKAYFYGDPLFIAKHYMPCIIIEKESGTIDDDATQTDRNSEVVTIKVVFNKEDDFNKSDTDDLTQKRIEDIIEAQDGDTNSYLPQSIVGILRTNFTLGNLIIHQKLDIKYGVINRTPVNAAQDHITAEGHVTVNIDQLLYLTNRS